MKMMRIMMGRGMLKVFICRFILFRLLMMEYEGFSDVSFGYEVFFFMVIGGSCSVFCFFCARSFLNSFMLVFGVEGFSLGLGFGSFWVLMLIFGIVLFFGLVLGFFL